MKQDHQASRSLVLLAFVILLVAAVATCSLHAAPSPIWVVNSPSSELFTSAPTASTDGTLYIGSRTHVNAYLNAYNSDGSMRWRVATPSIVNSTTVGHDGTIYANISNNNGLWAFFPDGHVKWSLPSGYFYSPGIGDDGTLYVGESGQKAFYALGSADGSVKRSSTSVCGGSAPAIAADGTLYVYGCDNNLHALAPDLSEKWRVFVSARIAQPPAIGSDGTVFAGGWSRLSAIAPSGSLRWVYAMEGFAAGTAIGPSGELYVNSSIHSGNFYAINSDGTQRWTFAPDNKPNSLTDAVVDANGMIYFGGWGDAFYALRPDGTIAWTLGSGVWWAPIVTNDGWLIAGTDSTLYAFDLPAGSAASSTWPMRGGNPQYSKRVAASQNAEGPHVVFLPGFAGSRLWEGEEKLWPTSNQARFIKLRPFEDGSVGSTVSTKVYDPANEANSGVIGTVGALEPIFSGFSSLYKDFFSFLEGLRLKGTISSWETVPYDWRKSVTDIASIDPFNPEAGISLCNEWVGTCDSEFSIVERIVEIKGSGMGPVTLIGHSNGGLLAKAVLAELERQPGIGPERVAEYVDRVFLVASPQLGTPQALLSLLHGEFVPIMLPRRLQRDVAETMPGAYALLPAASLAKRESGPMIEFLQVRPDTGVLEQPLIADFIRAYGQTIDWDHRLAFEAFLTGWWDNRAEPGEYVNVPNVLRHPLLMRAKELHHVLDHEAAWRVPTGVEIVQIVGVERVGTTKGIIYFPGGLEWDAVREGWMRPFIAYQGVVAVDDPGDGTVLRSSAAAMDVPTFHVNLSARCDDVEHMQILSSSRVQTIIESKLDPNMLYLGDGCVNSSLIPDSALSPLPTRRLELGSPATMHLFDESGRHTGPVAEMDPVGEALVYIERQVPNSVWRFTGGHENILVEAGQNYRLEVRGAGVGVFTLISDELMSDDESVRLIYPSVPVLPTTVAWVELPAGGGAGELHVDFSGDGRVDSVVLPGDSFVSAGSLHALSDLVYSLRLGGNVTRALVNMVEAAVRALEDDRLDDAIDLLEGFINHVGAQAGKAIPVDVATYLRVVATEMTFSLQTALAEPQY